MYDSGTGKGSLLGSDVDWKEYPVVGGLAQGLILNEDEIAWLRKTGRKRPADCEAGVARGRWRFNTPRGGCKAGAQHQCPSPSYESSGGSAGRI